MLITLIKCIVITGAAGKPPTGRPSTGGRPSSTYSHNSSGGSSSRSSLSRSTGNLLYSKSPSSLKRTDSAQSIRKESQNNNSNVSNSSLNNSSNTSRGSNVSSIPLATTPYSSALGSEKRNTIATRGNVSPHNSYSTSRVLQNSPLSKPKRESLSSRVRHADSLSRVHHHQQQLQQNVHSSDMGSNSPPTNTGSFLDSKPSSITSQLNSSLRRDLQLSASNMSSNGSASSTLRKTTTNQTSNPNSNRRFSSGSNIVARNTSNRTVTQQEHLVGADLAASNGSGTDSDSGKVRTLKSTFLGWLKI